MKQLELDELLALTRDPDPKTRRLVLRELCPCRVRSEITAIWDRVLEMRNDPDFRVRRAVLHALCDGSPSSRAGDVVAAVESMEVIRTRGFGAELVA